VLVNGTVLYWLGSNSYKPGSFYVDFVHEFINSDLLALTMTTVPDSATKEFYYGSYLTMIPLN
jgi:hypothetical protein